MKKAFQGIISLSIGLLIAFFLAEIVLHVYNPFPGRIRGNEILLKANYSKNVVLDPPVPGLDSSFIHSVNELGFRGESWPNKPAERQKMIVIGGSTTECSMQPNEKTWPAKMANWLKDSIPNIWVNNAGLDGCSTYGHIILLKDYVIDLQPDYVLFLIGVNDRGKANFDHEDGFLADRDEPFWRTLVKKSELLMLLDNFYKSYQAHKVNLGHHFNTTFEKNKQNQELPIPKKELDVSARWDFHQKYIPTYIGRVDSITKLCTNNNITPIFATQPLLDNEQSLGWKIMELYNHALLKYCFENQIMCIDLANALPKQMDLYYDNMHYSNKGAALVGKIMADSLLTKLN